MVRINILRAALCSMLLVRQFQISSIGGLKILRLDRLGFANLRRSSFFPLQQLYFLPLQQLCFLPLQQLCFFLALLFLCPSGALAFAPGGYTQYSDVSYGAGESNSEKLDLYLPTYASKPVPLIVWIHGGGWLQGDKSDIPLDEIASRQYAAASLNYRLSNEAHFPAQLDDCKTAIKWLKQHAAELKIDPNRLAVWGQSSGGHLALLVGLSGGNGEPPDQRVAAVCAWAAPTDLLSLRSQAKMPGQQVFASDDGQVARLLGAPVRDRLELANEASPVAQVTAHSAPILIVQGGMDEIVPPEQGEELYRKLKAQGVPAQLDLIQAGHTFSDRAQQKKALDFFDGYFR